MEIYSIQNAHLTALSDMGWLSDNVIEAYMSHFMLMFPKRGLFVASMVFDKILANKPTLIRVCIQLYNVNMSKIMYELFYNI